ncbi:MAG: hypothetical protein EA419_02625 [Wenzhouxiangella sp.]|nr:MAG: hypothetical protein EA419_02625 [Wenzhouxiangella sp.]
MAGQNRIELAPARVLTGLVSVMTMGAIAAILASSLTLFLQITMAALALLVGVRAARHLLFPSLNLRLLDGRLEYRRHRLSGWSSLDDQAQCFVSSFYIGWRDRSRRAVGVFRGQVADDEFRRISVNLRQLRRPG